MGNVDSLESNLCRNLQSDRKFSIYANAIFFLLLFVEQVPRSLIEDLDRSKWSLDRDKHSTASCQVVTTKVTAALPIQRQLIVPNVSNLEFGIWNILKTSSI